MSHLLDIVIVIIFAVTVLLCCYQGFLRSVLSLASFFVAILLSIFLSPFLAESLSEIDLIEVTLFSYSEGSEMLDEGEFELARKPISQLSSEQIDQVIENGNYPYPLGPLLEKNLYNQAFSEKGITQLADYISYTFLSFFCHVLAFLLVFLVAFGIAIIAIAVIDSAVVFPVLRRFDTLAAGGVGLLLALFLGMTLMLLIPIGLFMVGQQLEFVRNIVDESLFAQLFYKHNFLFWFIRAN